jgi:Zn-dependent protease
MDKLLIKIPIIASILVPVAVMSFLFSFKLGIVFTVNLWIAIFLHEMGHVIIGKLVGLSIVKVHVGPVQLDFSTGRRRLYLLRAYPLVGFVTLDPGNKSPDEAVVALRRAVIAGPLMSFACAIGSFWWFVSTWNESPRDGLSWFVCLNAMLAMSAIVPGDKMDGTQFRRLQKGSPKARNLVQGYRLALSTRKPGRPRERPSDLPALAVRLLNEQADQLFPGTKITAARFLYEYLADWGRLSEALAWLEWSSATVDLSKPATMSRRIDVLIALRALHYALWNNDPIHAEATLSCLHQRSWVHRCAEALMSLSLIQLSRGNREGAQELSKKVRRGLTRSFDSPGCAQMFSEWLDIIEQRINNAENTPALSSSLAHSAAD